MFESRDELRRFINERVMTAAEAADYLEISRSALSSLVRRGKLATVKDTPGQFVFLREDVEERKRQSQGLREKYRPYD